TSRRYVTTGSRARISNAPSAVVSLSPCSTKETMFTRRQLLSSAALATGASLLRVPKALADAPIPTAPSTPHFDVEPNKGPLPYVPVETPNGVTMPWKMENGVKVFHLVAEQVQREFAPGMIVN